MWSRPSGSSAEPSQGGIVGEEEKPGGLGEATPERVREARNPPVCCVEERGDGVKPTHAWRRPVWYPRDGKGVESGLRCRPLFPRL